jgi:hypothetical protein
MVFDIYFSGLGAMSIHPGAGRSNGYGIADQLTLEECAEKAVKMVEIRRGILFE